MFLEVTHTSPIESQLDSRVLKRQDKVKDLEISLKKQESAPYCVGYKRRTTNTLTCKSVQSAEFSLFS